MPKKASGSGVLLLVGTTKGAFVFRSSGARTKWTTLARGERIGLLFLDPSLVLFTVGLDLVGAAWLVLWLASAAIVARYFPGVRTR